MKPLALLELPYSEILALIGIVSAVCGTLGTIGMLWLSSKFVRKTAYYFDKDHFDERLSLLKQAHDLAIAPTAGMQKSVEEMKAQLGVLSEQIQKMQNSVTEGIHGLDKRTSLLEQKQGYRRKGSAGR